MAGRFSEEEKARFAEERRVQLQKMHAQVAEKVVDLVNGDAWQEWLSVAAKFHRYSFSNQLAILMSRPDATAVAGYRTWRSAFGRQVNAGETGIRIFAPVTRQVEKLRPDGSPALDDLGKPIKVTTITGVRPTSVFDVSQTSGRPLPEQPRPTLLTGQAPPGLWDALQSFIEAQGFTVERGDCHGANGFTDFGARLVRVRDDVDEAQSCRTLAHEGAHVILRSPENGQARTSCRGRDEVEAESIAYLVTRAHHMEAGQYTFTYVAGWAEAALEREPAGTTLADVITSTGTRVVRAADTILASTKPPAAIDTVLDSMAKAVSRSVQVDRSWDAGPRLQPSTTRPRTHLPAPVASRSHLAPSR